MADISDYLKKILSAVYGKEVRQSIHDAIKQCYKDGKSGTIDLIARERIDNLVAQSGSTEGNSELTDIRVGADGKTYPTAGTAVREQFTAMTNKLDTTPDDILNIHVWEKFSSNIDISLLESQELELYRWLAMTGISPSASINYSDSIGHSDGNIVLAEPVSTVTYKSSSDKSKLDVLKGKYIVKNNECYKISESAVFTNNTKVTSNNLSYYQIKCSEAQKVESAEYATSYGYVTSSNKGDYPSTGQLGDYRYEYRCTVGEALSKIDEMKAQDFSKEIEQINQNKDDIQSLKDNKVEKEEGKGLSAEDYTTEEKEKLSGLENYDDAEIKNSISGLTDDVDELKGDLNNYAKSDFRYIPTTENNKFCRWDTGIIQSYEGKSVCSRIPVTELENVEIYSNNNVYSICFFNDETFISGSGGSSPSPKSFSIPANCNNVIISFDGLDTNIALVYRSKIDDYIVNAQVLPTYEFSVKTTKGFMRWDDGRILITNDYMMTQPFVVEPSKEYYVTGAIMKAVCFLNGNTFVSGIALNGVDHFTIPEGCNRCVVDFNIIADLPTIMVRDPLLRNTSPCYGKVLGCLGDSLTQGVGNNNHSWVDKMQSMCGFKSVYNYGVSGNTIEQMHDRINTMESALDYITLLGGTNNALWSNSQSIADFKASFDSLVSSIIEKYPTSKVLGIIPPKYNYSSGDTTRNWNVPTSPNNLKLIDFVNAEIEMYDKYSVPIVNLFSCCNIQPDINAQKIGLMPDGVHPNQKGYFDFIAPKIAEALKSI